MPLVSGYAYECSKPAEWKTCADDCWDVVAQSASGGTFLGFRNIDGARCTVWRKGKRVLAQTAASAKAPRGML